MKTLRILAPALLLACALAACGSPPSSAGTIAPPAGTYPPPSGGSGGSISEGSGVQPQPILVPEER